MSTKTATKPIEVAVLWSEDGGETFQALAFNGGAGPLRVYEKTRVESRACGLDGAQPPYVKTARELLAHFAASKAPIQVPAWIARELFQ